MGGSPRQGCSPLLIVMIVTGWVGVLFLFFQISSNTKNKAPDGPFLVLFLLKSVGVNQSVSLSRAAADTARFLSFLSIFVIMHARTHTHACTHA